MSRTFKDRYRHNGGNFNGHSNLSEFPTLDADVNMSDCVGFGNVQAIPDEDKWMDTQLQRWADRHMPRGHRY